MERTGTSPLPNGQPGRYYSDLPEAKRVRIRKPYMSVNKSQKQVVAVSGYPGETVRPSIHPTIHPDIRP